MHPIANTQPVSSKQYPKNQSMNLKRLIYRVLGKKEYKTLPPDDFILRLRSTVIGEGMLHPGNIWLMDYAIRKMPAGGVLLEIGSYGGLSANLLRYLLDKHQKTVELFCCDAWVYEGYHDLQGGITPWMDGRTDVLRTDFMAYIQQAYVQSCRLLSAHHLPYAIHCDSDTFFNDWRARAEKRDVFGREVRLGGPVSFAYIDGNHAYDYARRDFEHVAEFLLPGGFVLLDDSARHQTFGSARLARELSQRQGFSVVAENPHFLFRKDEK